MSRIVPYIKTRRHKNPTQIKAKMRTLKLTSCKEAEHHAEKVTVSILPNKGDNGKRIILFSSRGEPSNQTIPLFDVYEEAYRLFK
ncbi:hypothetical protein RRG08_016406 [Elysia crispata]|uniref:Uncharacterized protein n=1 Tax=Elysia crispata TaxID=231223 RepID=A0AAE0Y8P8_9GAST|nr:hypothetical protein RRG08_016406 [Elysia crispata]